MNFSKEAYFQRQTTLSEIGKEGQDRLQKARVLVIGCGGLGSPIAIYLATSGVGHIQLVDFDTVSIANLHRQVFYKIEDVDKPKVKILADEISKKAPYTEVTYTNKAVDKNTVIELISAYDVIVDGTDNLPIKYLINDACVLSKKPLVYGSLYKFDGYVASFNVLNDDGGYTCNLRDAFPKIATDIPSCEEAGTLNPIVGIIALLQVNEVVKLITKTGKLLTDQLLVYNALRNSQLKVKLKKNTSLNIKEIFKNTDYLAIDCIMQDAELLLSSSELKERMGDENMKIVSIIDNLETALPFDVHQKIPYKSFDVDKFIPDFKKNYVIVCNKGITSYDITAKLKQKYPNMTVFSLSKGIEEYK
jgi:adenylyltransferase/sulfurtransferase